MIPLDRKAGHEGMIDPRDMAGYGKKKPTSEPTLISKTITDNGIYNATDDSADGYSSVDVNVSGGSGNTYAFKALSRCYLDQNNHLNYGTTIANPIDNDGTFDVVCHGGNSAPGNDKGWGGPILLSMPAKRINYKEQQMTGEICFTPAENFDGFYLNGTTKITTTGDEITPGDGMIYSFKFDAMQSTHTIKQCGTDAAVVPFD